MPSSGPVDVTIRQGEVPDSLHNAKAKGVAFQAAPGVFLLSVGNVARYLVTDGNRIVIERAREAENRSVRVFLLGSAFGALLHQRGLLPLHGSAIAVNGGSVAFLGPSGTGKSTLAAAFLERGYKILADDVCALSVQEDGVPLAIPGYSQLNLWRDAAGKLGLETTLLLKARYGLEKYACPLGDKFCRQPLPLTCIYALETTNTREFDLTPLQGMDKLTPILHNTYRRRFLEGLGGRTDHFRHCAASGRHVKVVRVTRPSYGFLLDRLADLVESDFSS